MKLSKRFLISLPILIIGLLAVAYFIPLGGYSTKNACAVEPAVQQRLSVIKGESLEQVKQADTIPGPTQGCRPNTSYILYLL